MPERQTPFWTSVPGILTGLAAVLTAGTGLYVAVSRGGPAATPTPVASDASTPARPETARTAEATFAQRAVIEDADGYTHVRSAPSTDSAILATVQRGVVFRTQEQTGAWWPVRTVEGTVGYMHRSRIRLVDAR